MELRKRTKQVTSLHSGTTQRAIAALHAHAHDEASARGATALSLEGRLEPRLLGHAPDQDDLVLVLSKDEYVLQIGPAAQAVASTILESLKSSGSQRGTRAFTEPELAALEEGGAELLHAAPDRAGALRAILEFASLIGDAYTVQQAAQVLSVNPSRIRQRLTARPPTLYGIKDGGAWRIPKFQFHGRQLTKGIDRVISKLPADLSPVAVVRWFTLPSPDLEVDDGAVSPLQWLQAGGDPTVAAELAAGL
jgi:hypothetical protein